MGYVGNPQAGAFSSKPAKQDLTGASGTSLTLSHAVANAESISLFINNVRQEPTTAYSVSGTAVTLTGSVVASDDIYVIYNSLALQEVVPPDGSVGSAKIADGSVTATKLASGVQGVAGITTASTSGTAMSIDSSNRVLTPARPAFFAKGQTTAWRTLPDGTQWTTIVGGTSHTTGQTGNLLNKYAVDWTTASGGGLGNVGGHFDTSTGKFTAPCSGFYNFMFSIYAHKIGTASAGNYLSVNSVINTTILDDWTIYFHQDVNVYGSIEISRQWFLTAGQTFQFTLYQSAASQVAIYGQYVRFSGFLIG